MQPRLQGKVALVTGAGRGIGLAIAHRLAAEGAALAVNDIDEAMAQRATEAIAVAGGRAISVPCDIACEEAISQVVGTTVAILGGLDILVNNAGIDLVASPERTRLSDWDRLHAIDLRGAFLCAKEASPHLGRMRDGAIVNIASIHALATQPGRSAYAAAKAGLIGLTRALAVDLGPSGVRVNAVVPGYIETEIWKTWLNDVPDPEHLLSAIAQQHPVRRFGQPEDVAAVVAFLASHDASFVSGTTLVVDGGLTSTFISPPC